MSTSSSHSSSKPNQDTPTTKKPPKSVPRKTRSKRCMIEKNVYEEIEEIATTYGVAKTDVFVSAFLGYYLERNGDKDIKRILATYADLITKK